MSTSYNVFAGQSLERLTALSDGVFAVAMTLLVLDLRAPASGEVFCLVNTYLSIAVIVLVQLNYVVAPRIRGLYRL